jgi:hypothetical protein
MGQLAIGTAMIVMKLSGGYLMDPGLIEASRTRLSTILARAGITVEWRDCDGPSRDDS